MGKTTPALSAVLLLAGSIGVSASSSTPQPSYDALMAMSADERQQALRAMDVPTHLAMSRTHIDSWLAENRDRMSSSQVALVTEVRNHLTPDLHDSERLFALEQRMRCELWMSDVFSLTLPEVDRSFSGFQDAHYWLRQCVMEPAIELLF